MDFDTQRMNMIESQVRPSDIVDRRLIRAMATVRRELFVPASVRALAYMEGDVPLAGTEGKATRGLMAPRTLARLIQLADVMPGDAVLVVGSATGYTAAVLSHLAAKVVALESDRSLAGAAREALASSGAATVTVAEGELAGGWPERAPYDLIVLDGAVEEVPVALARQLTASGRLVGIVRRGPVGRAVIQRRIGETVDETTAFDAAAPALPGFARAAAFTF